LSETQDAERQHARSMAQPATLTEDMAARNTEFAALEVGCGQPVANWPRCKASSRRHAHSFWASQRRRSRARRLPNLLSKPVPQSQCVEIGKAVHFGPQSSKLQAGSDRHIFGTRPAHPTGFEPVTFAFGAFAAIHVRAEPCSAALDRLVNDTPRPHQHP